MNQASIRRVFFLFFFLAVIVLEGRCPCYAVYPPIIRSNINIWSKIMTLLATFAYGFIVFGPIGALFCTTVAPHPYEIIVSIAG